MFPVPIIDWYYGARNLRQGGVVLVDDTNLVSVRLGLSTYLRRSPNWRRTNRTLKWQSYERLNRYELGAGDQAFLGSIMPDVLAAERVIPAQLRPLIKKVVDHARIL